MNVASVSRPSGCLKAALRRTRYQRACQRSFVTTARAQAATPSPFNGRQRDDIARVSHFKVWPQVPSIRKTHPNPLPQLQAQQIAKLDPTGARTRMFSKLHLDSAKVGDVLMVTPKSGEPFAGVLMQIRRAGVDTAIQLRGQLMRTSTEMWYKIYSPTVSAIDIIWRRPKRARRSRLTYLRQPKHDMGNVDNLVFAWRKERFALRSKEKNKAMRGGR